MKIKINNRTVDLPRRVYAHCPNARNELTRKHTVFPSFKALMSVPGPYRLSINLGGKARSEQQELVFLAFSYNEFQKARGDGRRVSKGDWRPVFHKEFPILAEANFACAVPDCTQPGCDIAPISINNAPKCNHGVCRQHLDAAQEDCKHDYKDGLVCVLCGYVRQTGD